MLKPEQVTLQALQQLLKRAFYPSRLSKDWLTVADGLGCLVNIAVDAERQFVRLDARFKPAHLDETEIAAAAHRLNNDFFLVKFIGTSDMLIMSYVTRRAPAPPR